MADRQIRPQAIRQPQSNTQPGASYGIRPHETAGEVYTQASGGKDRFKKTTPKSLIAITCGR